jgi:gas vesicle protein
MKHNTTNYISAFIIGGVASGVITLLYAPYSGEEFRKRVNSNIDNLLQKAKQKEEEIVNKAKIAADDIVTKSIKLSVLIEKYAGEIGLESRWKIENEILSLKTAIKAAVDMYKNGSANSQKYNSTKEMVEDIFSDYDNVVLPKIYYKRNK